MKNYEVALIRGYVVSINAQSKEDAMRLAEFYVGNCADDSDNAERTKHNFLIEGIELTYNEAMEAAETTD